MNIFRNVASIAIIGVLFFVFETGLGMHLNGVDCPARCQQSKGGENVVKGGERSKFYYFSQSKKECRQATGKGPWRQPSHEENRFRSRQECQESCGNCLAHSTLNNTLGEYPADNNGEWYGCTFREKDIMAPSIPVGKYCWSWCSTGIGFLLPEWCYTTKSFSQSYELVPCNSKADCTYNWSCGASCRVG